MMPYAILPKQLQPNTERNLASTSRVFNLLTASNLWTDVKVRFARQKKG